MRLRLIALLALSCVLVHDDAASASPTGDGFLGDLVAHVRDALERASIERAPKPPVPVAHQWRTKKRGSFELGAPLLAMESADLDELAGDELIALTTTELIVFKVASKPSITARVALPGKAAVIRSRDPVGTISIERGVSGAIIAVRTSEQQTGARFRLEGKALVLVGELAGETGFPLCTGIRAQLQPGRNSFDPASLKVADGAWPQGMERPAKPFYRLECRDVIGVDGRLNRVVGVTGLKREVSVGCSRGAAPCEAGAVPDVAVTAAGVAFEVADLNRDGRAEIVASYGRAPRTDDRVRVFGRTAKSEKLLKQKKFDAGIIAITAVDREGDGRRHLFFAVRQSSDKRINLWTLNRHP